MFGLGQAQSVRRNALHSPETSPRSSPDPSFTELFRSRITQNEFSYTNVEPINDGPFSDDDDEAEIRLFAGPPSTTAPQALKIRVASPDMGDKEPGFVVPNRPHSYYFSELDAQTKKEFEAVAVDGQTVIRWSQEPWPGCAIPWKVKTISSNRIKKSVLIGHPQKIIDVTEAENKKRTRKGKKMRIALRKKSQAASAKAEEGKRRALEKEETEREKRTRRNREKKVKKKAREKAKKAEGKAAVDEGEGGKGAENPVGKDVSMT
ncbi:hypothetical protein GQ43DRAFT_249917 [Delitschia confertaspora ATCC 74209]|uniref:Uncharacterized protein n=1 Tax=Delitschia confertaspora ATCC 74209 TaxID=1513339 RepID=A0A9P4JQG1_9PLEO|nr:hypothetical protein GQ43DRAFT_249917 [Delitschia confertaspora ATCC 74209]